MSTKICTECKTNKELSDYYAKKSGKYGKDAICKSCRIKKYSNSRKAYYKTYKRKHDSYVSNRTYPNGKKTCGKCNVEKLLSDFYYDSSRKDYKSQCKECKIEITSKYAKNNRDKINKSRKKRFKENPQLRIKSSYYTRLNQCYKKKYKSKTLLYYMGCSFEQFIEWIHFQFEKGMTFDNYGSEWHMDHVKPCASFDLTKENDLKECMNWKNIRPCWGKENISKSDKIDMKLIKKQNKIADRFIKKSI